MVNRKQLPSFEFTKAGFDKMRADHNRLEKERAEILIRLQAAREMGDLSENGAYKAARFELSSTDRQLRKLKYLIQFGHVSNKKNSDKADFGSNITLKHGSELFKFMLVSSFESDPKKSKLSVESPIGKAVLYKKVGDVIEVSAPAGKISYVIEAIS